MYVLNHLANRLSQPSDDIKGNAAIPKQTVSNVDLLDGLMTAPPMPPVGPAMFVMAAQPGFIGMMPTGSTIVSPAMDHMVQSNVVGGTTMIPVQQTGLGSRVVMGLGDGTGMATYSTIPAASMQNSLMVSNFLVTRSLIFMAVELLSVFLVR